jgi:hypothetical protein
LALAYSVPAVAALSLADSLFVCCGNPEEATLAHLRSGLINPVDADGRRKFYLNSMDFGGREPGSREQFVETLRSRGCLLLYHRHVMVSFSEERQLSSS